MTIGFMYGVWYREECWDMMLTFWLHTTPVKRLAKPLEITNTLAAHARMSMKYGGGLRDSFASQYLKRQKTNKGFANSCKEAPKGPLVSEVISSLTPSHHLSSAFYPGRNRDVYATEAEWVLIFLIIIYVVDTN
jgi:hypothetical protein